VTPPAIGLAPFKIVWKELLNLEILYLDLRSYSGRNTCMSAELKEVYHLKLNSGAAKM